MTLFHIELPQDRSEWALLVVLYEPIAIPPSPDGFAIMELIDVAEIARRERPDSIPRDAAHLFYNPKGLQQNLWLADRDVIKTPYGYTPVCWSDMLGN